MPRSLLPREHGAYVQLAAPLVATCAAFGATWGSALVAVAACLAFVANEPLLVVLGHRGKRMKTEDGGRARRLLAILVPAAAVSGIAGLALAPAAVPAAAIVAVPAAILVGFAWKKRERSLAGELVAAVSLTGAAFPVTVAAGATLHVALMCWVSWALGFAFTVVAVHRVIAQSRRPARARHALVAAAAIAAACAVVALDLWVVVPLAVCSAVLIVLAPHARHLRTIGFVMVGASVASMALLLHTVA